MKRLLLILTVILLSNSVSNAYDINETKDCQYQKNVMETGFKILNANRIEKRIIFKYVEDNNAKLNVDSKSKTIFIPNEILAYLDNDAELAGILSHEIAHDLDYYKGFFRKLAMSPLSLDAKKYELKADKKAVDYMVKAGYNPVALIIAINKVTGERKGITYPQGSKRLATIYEYIYTKYPAYLVQNEYKENIYYQNFLLTSKDVREKIREKSMKNVSNTTKKSI